MAAGILARGAAGLKNNGALLGWQTSHIELLKSGGRHGGGLVPVSDAIWRATFVLTKAPIRAVVDVLKFKEG